MNRIVKMKGNYARDMERNSDDKTTISKQQVPKDNKCGLSH